MAEFQPCGKWVESVPNSSRPDPATASDRDAILTLAERLHLAVLTGSDNHGWGRTAPAWSVLRIAGWRGMTPPELDIAIRRTIIAQRSRAVSGRRSGVR